MHTQQSHYWSKSSKSLLRVHIVAKLSLPSKVSNHTGYPNGFEGDILDGDQLKTLLGGLKRNGLLEDVGHILTGYIGKESFLRGVIDVLQTLRNHTKGKMVRYVCDPVLGDSGKFYVPQDLVSIYRDEVIPLADVVTPNQFEVEQLTGISVRSIEDAKRACQALHDIGPELVVITSLVFEDAKEVDDKREKTITILASSRVKREAGGYEDELWSIDSPILPGRFTGTGDLCAALLLGWTARESNLAMVMQKVISTMYCVIKSTWEHQSENLNNKNNELRLIQSKKVIEDPPDLFEAQKVADARPNKGVGNTDGALNTRIK